MQNKADIKSDIKSASDTKKFWKTIRPYFSNKELNCNKIFVYENGRLIKNPVTKVTTLHGYSINITQTTGLKQFQFDHANNVFEDHTDMFRIKSNLDNVSDEFDF